MDTILDVFKQDAFNCISMTQAIATPPFIPGRAGDLINWQEDPITTTVAVIEEEDGELALIDPSPRGGPGSSVADTDRSARTIAVPHYKVRRAVYADEVQNVRAFGSTSILESVNARVEKKMADTILNKFDPTVEHQRVGAVKGIITKGSGATMVDLFDLFDVTQETEVAFDLSNGSPANGALRKACAGVVRKIMDNLKGVALQGGVHSFCGDAFFDDLLSHVEVTNSYKNTPMAEVLRQGYVYPNGQKVYGAFEFGGIVWENYRGSVGGTSFIHTDKCHLFPVGVQGLWHTVLAPADWVEFVNTPGQRRYARQWEMEGGAGINILMQLNTINYCSKPKTLMKGKRGA